jgi:hypothetical protein
MVYGSFSVIRYAKGVKKALGTMVSFLKGLLRTMLVTVLVTGELHGAEN